MITKMTKTPAIFFEEVQKVRKTSPKEKLLKKEVKDWWARPGFEPGTTRTLSEYHTPRPTSRRYQLSVHCNI